MNFLFIAFNKKVCAELKRQMPAYRVYWVTSGENLTAEDICRTLKRLGADGVDISYDGKIHDAAFIRKIHDAGYSFNIWTVDDPQEASEAFSRGIDTLTTNRAQFILNQFRVHSGR